MTDSDRTITVRRMAFPFSADMERVFIRNDPAGSYLFLGTWMMLPYLEPYLIRTMGQALPHVTDPALKAAIRGFCAQEGEHHRQHARANDVIRSLRPGFAALKALEAELDAEYRSFTRTRSLAFNLAYAEGFEALTCATACTQLQLGAFDRVDSPLAALAKWHVMEELEHRSVAFDVYRHIVGGWRRRVIAGIRAQAHFIRWGLRFARLMREADAETMAAYDSPAQRADRNAFNRLYLRHFLPRALRMHMPWYDPARIALPPAYEEARQHFSAVATEAAPV
ncbi:metal-dependent hydrolase [Sphingomonas flavalba]|uniref:metal-dependent hydrolase n=1 Tax=Sphingomonas flavalba TaxID=2559804 RepID=UPI00109E09B6|nr:metal-dependent hydrolase [Sphingomonas flavalba]